MSKKQTQTPIKDLIAGLLAAEKLGNLPKIQTMEWALRRKLFESYDHYLLAKRHSLWRLRGLTTSL